MKKTVSVVLIIVMVVCFAGALYYPLSYLWQKDANETDMDALREMRRAALENGAAPEQTEPAVTDGSAAGEESRQTTAEPAASPTDATASVQPPAQAALQTQAPGQENVAAEADPSATQDDGSEPVDRRQRSSSAIPYTSKEIVTLDPDRILPQYVDIYGQNQDMVGWLSISGTPIDYPVLQSEVRDYYLRRDFYGNKNANGQLILDSACDPWTPSYNLVISGHNMKSGKMFGTLANYASKSYWAKHKTFTYDSLMREGTYVVFAAFYSADYDVDEEGFRYNADIRYKLDADMWLEEVRRNQVYDTGIDVEFGDEIITLTTCLYQRENGRFVVVARRVRDGEVIE